MSCCTASAVADKLIATLAYMPNVLQGRSFGIMTAFCSAGSILGNVVGTRLYRMGKSDSLFNVMSLILRAQHGSSANDHASLASKENGSGIAIPFVVAAALLGCGGAALVLISRNEAEQRPAYDPVSQTEVGCQVQADEVDDSEGMELTSMAPPHAIDDPDFRVRRQGELRIRRQAESGTNI